MGLAEGDKLRLGKLSNDSTVYRYYAGRAKLERKKSGHLTNMFPCGPLCYFLAVHGHVEGTHEKEVHVVVVRALFN